MMAKSFEQLKSKISPVRRKDIDHKAHAILNDMTLQEELQDSHDSHDLQALRVAKEEEQDAPTISFEEAKKELGLS